MTRILTALVLAILLPALPVGADTAPDQLIPIDADYTMLESLGAYHRALRERLLLSDRPPGVWVVVVPSFRNEWAVQVSNSGGRPVVALVLADDSLWGLIGSRGLNDSRKEAIVLPTIGLRVSVRRAGLSDASGSLVREAWAARLRAATIPESPRRVIDGTSWFFSAPESDGTRCSAIAREPQDGSPAAALTSLVLALREHVEAEPRDRARTEAAIVRQAEAAIR